MWDKTDLRTLLLLLLLTDKCAEVDWGQTIYYFVSCFRAVSEARRKFVLKLFANLCSCKSLDRQRVSGGWLCARHEAFLHHILRSMGGKCWLCIKYYHYLYSARDSQRAALFFFFPLREGFFHFALSVPPWPTPALKKAERGKVCQFRCYPLLVLRKEMKILSKWNLRL